MSFFNQRTEEQTVQDVLKTLDRWYIAASGDGCLWIQPRQPVLKLQDFCALLKRIHRMATTQRLDLVVFHFDGVQAPRSLWVIIMRLLTALAKSTTTDCRMIRSIKVNGPVPVEPDTSGNSALARNQSLLKLNGISVVLDRKTDRGVRFDYDHGLL